MSLRPVWFGDRPDVASDQPPSLDQGGRFSPGWVGGAAPRSDRSDFQYHRNHTNRELPIDGPIRSKSTGEWILPISRRINNPDGRFGGAVLAIVSVNFLQLSKARALAEIPS